MKAFNLVGNVLLLKRVDVVALSYRKGLIGMLLGLFLGVFSCTPATTNEELLGCQNDEQCVDGFICNIENGQCLCRDDDSCDASEFCNALGRCQPQTGCLTTDDCRDVEHPNDICDTVTQSCVTLNATDMQCVLSSHCPFGSTCLDHICVRGCADAGDCALGQPCIDNQCDGRVGACSDNSFCEYGQLCNLDNNTCEDHPEYNTLCSTCTLGPFTGIPSCNPCLIDATIAPTSCNRDSDCSEDESYCDVAGGGFCKRNFCGTTSCNDETNPCPRGYQCYTLSVVSGAPCTPNNNTCGDGRGCSAAGEGVNSGYCSCLNDGHCPQGTECINPGEFGSCISGSSCGPIQGLTCWDMRP